MNSVKLLIVVLFLSLVNVASAQKIQTAKKASKGTFIAEGQAQIGLFFFYGPTVTPSLKFRYFINDQYVVNTSLRVSANSQSREITEFPDGTGGTGTFEWTNTNVGINVGVEKHFGMQERFSPWVSLAVGYEKGKQEQNSDDVDRYRYRNDYEMRYSTTTNNQTVEGIVGADYWITRNFYIGMDMGLMYSRYTSGEGTTVITTGGVTTETENPSNSGYTIGDRINTSMRLGFRFN